MSERNTLGAALSTLRARRLLSLRELGRLSGIDHAYLYRLETEHKSSPSAEVIAKLVKALKLDARDSKLVKRLALGPEAAAAVKEERERVLNEIERTAASFYDRNICGGNVAWFDASEELRERIAKLRSEP
jgi:transcriptional regulator with XRE-family HTH domain